LVFSDIVMPGGLDGFAVKQSVEEERPGTPVVLTTGHAETILKQGAEYSSVKILGKPYRLNELSNAIKASLQNKAIAA
jgi:DNA-binding NtrC family response regulator